MKYLLSLTTALLIALPMDQAMAVPRKLKLISHVLTTNVVDIGTTGDSVGDIAVHISELLDARTQRVLGKGVFRKIVVNADAQQQSNTSDNLVELQLAGGTITAVGLTSDSSSDHLIKGLVKRAIIGGTGIYSGVKGVLINAPINGKPGYFIIETNFR